MAKTDQQARLWATFAHLSSVAGFVIPFGNILGPLFIWLIKKEESSLVDDNGKNSLNFQISITIYMFAAGFLSIFLIGIPILIGLIFVDIILVIRASIMANKGETYKYPLAITFIK